MAKCMLIRSDGRALLLALVLSSSMARASTIVLTLNVNVWDEHEYATMTDNLQSFNTTAKVSFDDSVYVIESDPNDLVVEYGLPVIHSALTETLPYSPVSGAALPSSEVALDDRNYGPSQQWSEFAVVESQETLLPGPTAWTYNFELDSGSQSPLIPNLAQNGTAALYSQLLAYQQNGTPLTFDEFAYQFDTQTGQALAGLGYRATAFITNVQAPEPCSFAMMSAAVALYLLNYACKRNQYKLTA
jgi:hypothetical protein